MQIVLIGYMGSGKTTVGKQLAKAMGLRFIDLDHFFEARYKISVYDFFQKYDEQAFRLIETKLLKEALQYHNIILSTGGGTPCFGENMKIILEKAFAIYIKMPPTALTARLHNARRKRPLIRDQKTINLKTYIQNHLREREPYYRQAHLVINGQNIDIPQLSENILQYHQPNKH